MTLVHIENRNGEVHRCTSTAITWSCWPATVWRQPAALGGSTHSTSPRTRPTTSPSWPTSPGIWMDHCHNLKHAAQGMIAHLMYEGFDTPYRIAGPADNQPE